MQIFYLLAMQNNLDITNTNSIQRNDDKNFNNNNQFQNKEHNTIQFPINNNNNNQFQNKEHNTIQFPINNNNNNQFQNNNNLNNTIQFPINNNNNLNQFQNNNNLNNTIQFPINNNNNNQFQNNNNNQFQNKEHNTIQFPINNNNNQFQNNIVNIEKNQTVSIPNDQIKNTNQEEIRNYAKSQKDNLQTFYNKNMVTLNTLFEKLNKENWIKGFALNMARNQIDLIYKTNILYIDVEIANCKSFNDVDQLFQSKCPKNLNINPILDLNQPAQCGYSSETRVQRYFNKIQNTNMSIEEYVESCKSIMGDLTSMHNTNMTNILKVPFLMQEINRNVESYFPNTLPIYQCIYAYAFNLIHYLKYNDRVKINNITHQVFEKEFNPQNEQQTYIVTNKQVIYDHKMKNCLNFNSQEKDTECDIAHLKLMLSLIKMLQSESENFTSTYQQLRWDSNAYGKYTNNSKLFNNIFAHNHDDTAVELIIEKGEKSLNNKINKQKIKNKKEIFQQKQQIIQNQQQNQNYKIPTPLNNSLIEDDEDRDDLVALFNSLNIVQANTENELNNSFEKINNLNNQLNSSINSIKSLEEQKEKDQIYIKNLNEQLQLKSSELQKLQMSTVNSFESLQSQIKEKDQKLEALRVNGQKMIDDTINTKLQQLNQQYQQHYQQVFNKKILEYETNLKSDNNQQLNLLKEKDELLNNIKQEKFNLENNIQQLKEEIINLKQKICNLEQQVKENQNQMDTDLKFLKQSILVKDKNNLIPESIYPQNDMFQQDQITEELIKKNTKLTQEIAELTNAKNNLEIEKQKLKEQLLVLDFSKNKYKTQLSELSKKALISTVNHEEQSKLFQKVELEQKQQYSIKMNQQK